MIEQSLSIIIVAGGIGTRMKSAIPKQFLMLQGRCIANYCFDLFLSLPHIAEMIVVCDPLYQALFSAPEAQIPIRFAVPGARRQDSVFNGFKMLSKRNAFVCIHDAVRPFVTASILERTIAAAKEHGAAAAGMPLKATVKVCSQDQMVNYTPDRSTLWEVQTPQILRYDLLEKGLENAQKNGITVTDDASLIEILGFPVKMVEGSYSNLKITTPEDLTISEQLLYQHV